MEFQDPIGHATPLHVHGGEDEVWIVLDGEISFFVGDERYDLEPGQAAFGPRGVPHAYLVRSRTAKLAATFAPGRTRCKPLTTTESDAVSPSSTTRKRSCCWPSRTARYSTSDFPFTTYTNLCPWSVPTASSGTKTADRG